MTDPIRHRTPAAAPAHLPVVGHITLLPLKVLAIIAQSLPPDDIRSFLRTCKFISSAKTEIELAIRRSCRQAFHQFFSHVEMKILTRKPLESLRTLSERQVVKLLIQEMLDQLTLQNTLPSKVIIQYLLISFLGTLNDPQFDLLKSAIAMAHRLKEDFQKRAVPPNDLRSISYGVIAAGKNLLRSSHRSLTGRRLLDHWHTKMSDPQEVRRKIFQVLEIFHGKIADSEKIFSTIVVPIFHPNYFQPNPLAESDLERLDHLHQFSRSNPNYNFARIVDGLAEMQRVPRAITVARIFASVEVRNTAFAGLSYIFHGHCIVLAKRQRLYEALGMANMITDERYKSTALFKISKSALKLKKIHLAISAARIISIPHYRDQAFLHIFHSLIDLQRFILATSIANKLDWKWQKKQLLLIVCWHLGKLERFTQAHRVADKLADPNVREDTHRRIDEHKKLVTKMDAHWQFANAALFS